MPPLKLWIFYGMPPVLSRKKGASASPPSYIPIYELVSIRNYAICMGKGFFLVTYLIMIEIIMHLLITWLDIPLVNVPKNIHRTRVKRTTVINRTTVFDGCNALLAGAIDWFLIGLDESHERTLFDWLVSFWSHNIIWALIVKCIRISNSNCTEVVDYIWFKAVGLSFFRGVAASGLTGMTRNIMASRSRVGARSRIILSPITRSCLLVASCDWFHLYLLSCCKDRCVWRLVRLGRRTILIAGNITLLLHHLACRDCRAHVLFHFVVKWWFEGGGIEE